MIKAVLFDIGGTVHVQDGSPERDIFYGEMLYEYLDSHEIKIPKNLPMLIDRVNKGAKAYKAYIEGELIELESDRIWKEFMLKDYDFPKFRLDGLGEDLSYMFDRYKKKITIRDGLGDTLEALRQKGYRLGVISNIMSTTFVPKILKEHGVEDYFECIVMSSACGIRKPDPRIFDIALSEMGLEKEEACYIGDTVSRDVRGILAAGWEMMIQIENPRISHKDEKFKGMGYEPDFKIKSLPEIVPILQQYNQSQRERV